MPRRDHVLQPDIFLEAEITDGESPWIGAIDRLIRRSRSRSAVSRNKQMPERYINGRALHLHRRLLADATAFGHAGLGVNGDEVALALARILALAIVRGGLAGALSLARIDAKALDLRRAAGGTRRVRGICGGPG